MSTSTSPAIFTKVPPHISPKVLPETSSRDIRRSPPELLLGVFQVFFYKGYHTFFQNFFPEGFGDYSRSCGISTGSLFGISPIIPPCGF